MFLNRTQINERIKAGGLRVDPLFEDDVRSACLDLRLGTDFAEQSHQTGIDLPAVVAQPKSIEFGQNYFVEPGTGLLVTTLQYITMPADLLGIVLGLSAMRRIGVDVPAGSIDPGYQGKLVLTVNNLGAHRVAFTPGLRIARLLLAPVDPEPHVAHTSTIRPWHSGGTSGEFDSEGLETLKRMLARQSSALRLPQAQPSSLRGALESVKALSGAERGRALEAFAAAMFSTIRGLEIIRKNARLRAEEFDLYIANNNTHGFWRVAGTPLIVECKGGDDRTGAAAIGTLFDKLQSISPDAKTAVLIALSGVTSDARVKMREKRQKGIYVILLEIGDLEEIAGGAHAAHVIERNYSRLMLM